MNLFRIALLAFTAFTCMQSAKGQTPDAAPARVPQASVSVKGNKISYLWAYRGLQAGLDVFDRKRDELASGASLRFVIQDYKKAGMPPGAVVKVVGEDAALTLPVDEDGGFVLKRSPTAFADDADVVLVAGTDAPPQRERGDFFTYPEPQVRSPNLPFGTWRMGDLRLACHMNLAMFKKTSSLLMSMAVRIYTIGKDFCSSSSDPEVRGNIGFTAPAPFDSATLIDGERRKVIGRGKKRHTLQVPISENWSNDTLIVFQFSGNDATSSPHEQAGEAAPIP